MAKADEIESTGGQYNELILEDKDFVPSRVYKYQIKKRNQMLAEDLKGLKIKAALDLGCGTGFHSKEIDKKTQGLLVLSDLSRKALEKTKNLGLKNKTMLVCCDAARFSLPKTRELDFVHIAGMLHHIPKKIPQCISSFARYMPSGALVVIDEPNKFNPANFLLMKASKADPTGEERPLSAGKVKAELERNGFEVKQLKYYGLLVPAFLMLSGKKTILGFFEKLDTSLGKTPLRLLFFRWRLKAVKK
jgi:SAM-dependent methyltransferase